jgi:hypothetical protein
MEVLMHGPGTTGEIITSEDIESGGNAESENPVDSKAVTQPPQEP